MDFYDLRIKDQKVISQMISPRDVLDPDPKLDDLIIFYLYNQQYPNVYNPFNRESRSLSRLYPQKYFLGDPMYKGHQKIKVDVNIGMYEGQWTPLMCAANYGLFETCQMLIQRRAKINYREPHSYRTSALIQLCYGRPNLPLLDLLLQNGADPNIEDLKGCTPLCIAVNRHHYEIAKRLIEAGADVNHVAEKYNEYTTYTPLLSAVCNGFLDIAELLLDHGADLHFRTKQGSITDFAVTPEIKSLFAKYQ